ncbi:MAG TPA: hypothetical protein VGJ97_05125 [Anaerolineaceae bacterium]|jgi:site-specific DNA-methyltransferase (adenine-specific)
MPENILYYGDHLNVLRRSIQKAVILSVKAGKIGADHIRVLQSVVERECAQIGVLLTMQEPIRTMRAEAAGSGVYHSPFT